MTPEELKPAFDALQEGLSNEYIRIREGVVIEIDEKSRFPFEFFCWRSPEMVREMDLFIKYCKGKRRFMDIGAHMGIFSMVFAEVNKNGEVRAYEPSVEPFNVLNKNTRPYKNINPYPIAISDQAGRMWMNEEWDHFIADTEGKKTWEIPTETGEAILRTAFQADIIKIDVEGLEWRVLKGMKTYLKKKHPIIFLELHPERILKQGDSVKDIIQLLEECEYIPLDTETDDAISWADIKATTGKDLRLILQ